MGIFSTDYSDLTYYNDPINYVAIKANPINDIDLNDPIEAKPINSADSIETNNQS